MLKWIETTGRSEEDAISAALFQLGLDRDDVSVEVIERAKSGFLGFGSNPAKVRVSYQEVDGVARPITDEVLVEKEAPKGEPKKQAAVPAAKVAPSPAVKEAPKKEEATAAPAEEETILSAKPGMTPPRARQPRQERRERPRRQESRLQAGDEVLIGSAPAPLTTRGPTVSGPFSPA